MSRPPWPADQLWPRRSAVRRQLAGRTLLTAQYINARLNQLELVIAGRDDVSAAPGWNCSWRCAQCPNRRSWGAAPLRACRSCGEPNCVATLTWQHKSINIWLAQLVYGYWGPAPVQRRTYP